MKATENEILILNELLKCRFQPGSFDKNLPREIDANNISPLQKWWIYKLGFKYRKQIKNDIIQTICKNYIDCNNMPLSRRESKKVLANIRNEIKQLTK